MRFRLAALFGCSVRELGQRLPSDEWPLWYAFYLLEPWGFEQKDIHSAVIASTVANFSGHVKSALSVNDFLLKKPQQPELTPEEEEAYLIRIFGNGSNS